MSQHTAEAGHPNAGVFAADVAFYQRFGQIAEHTGYPYGHGKQRQTPTMGLAAIRDTTREPTK